MNLLGQLCIPGASHVHTVTLLTERGHEEVTGPWQVPAGWARDGVRMTSSTRRPWLYDPSVGGVLVRAHRSPAGGPAADVVSDVLWSEVLVLLRWAEATLGCAPALAEGAAWRTAAAAAALLRRLPGLCAESGLPWPGVEGDPAEAVLPGRERLAAAADRLAGLLCARSPETGPLELVARVAADVDAIGAAAIAVLVEGADWTATS